MHGLLFMKFYSDYGRDSHSENDAAPVDADVRETLQEQNREISYLYQQDNGGKDKWNEIQAVRSNCPTLN